MRLFLDYAKCTISAANKRAGVPPPGDLTMWLDLEAEPRDDYLPLRADPGAPPLVLERFAGESCALARHVTGWSGFLNRGEPLPLSRAMLAELFSRDHGMRAQVRAAVYRLTRGNTG